MGCSFLAPVQKALGAEQVLPIVGAAFLGPAAGALMGTSAAVGSAAVGAAAGGLAAGVSGGNVIGGALLGGAGGYVAGGGLNGLFAPAGSAAAAGGSVGDMAATLPSYNPALTPLEAMNAAEAYAASGMTAGQLTQAALGGSLPSASTVAQQVLQKTGVNTPVSVTPGNAGAVPSATPGNTSFDWGQWAQSLLTPQSLLSVGSGLYGMYQSGKIADQSAIAAREANPWGTSGGYALAGQQLQDLMRNPTQVAATDPSYQLRIQGAQRAMASYGQDSGAMASAAANASTDWFNQRLQQLGPLAGVNFNPVNSAQLGLTGQTQAVNLQGQSLGSIGYGVNPALQAAMQRIGSA